MKWHEAFNSERMPTTEEIREYIGEGKSLWDELVHHVEETYQAKQQVDYSKCSAQPGWNVKFKKSGKSLCTLYPMSNYFIALVVVGRKEEEDVDLAMEEGVFSKEVKQLYQKTPFSAMGKWLMIEVKDKEILQDVKILIRIRATSKR